jgi:hypothetical protein
VEVVGQRTLLLEGVDLARHPLTGYANFDRARPSGADALALLTPLSNFAGQVVQDNLFRAVTSEAEFQERLRLFLRNQPSFGSQLEERRCVGLRPVAVTTEADAARCLSDHLPGNSRCGTSHWESGQANRQVILRSGCASGRRPPAQKRLVCLLCSARPRAQRRARFCEGKCRFPAIERNDGRNADAGKRGVFALRQPFLLTAADCLLDIGLPIEGSHSPSILGHARLTISVKHG